MDQDSDLMYQDSDNDECLEEDFRNDNDTPPVKRTEASFKCITFETIRKEQEEKITEISGCFNISPLFARILLELSEWDTQSASQQLIDPRPSNQEKIAFIRENCELRQNSLQSEECQICLEKVTTKSHLPCHTICNRCLGDYITAKIKDNKNRVLTCPGLGLNKRCDSIIDEYRLQALLANNQDVYQQLMIRSYINNCTDVKSCPSPGCRSVIKLIEPPEKRDDFPVKCDCGLQFCFQCLREDHQPASCSMMTDWRQTTQEFNRPIQDRPCPNCRNPVKEKQFDNDMQCPVCYTRFCWECKMICRYLGGEEFSYYSAHGNNHNRIDQTESALNEKKRLDWLRHAKYKDPYEHHLYRIEKEAYLLNQELGARFSKAVTSLIDARKTLARSYIFGFFRPLMRSNVNKIFFEFHQDALVTELDAFSTHLFSLSNNKGTAEYHLLEQDENLLEEFTRKIEGRIKTLFEIIYNPSNEENPYEIEEELLELRGMTPWQLVPNVQQLEPQPRCYAPEGEQEQQRQEYFDDREHEYECENKQEQEQKELEELEELENGWTFLRDSQDHQMTMDSAQKNEKDQQDQERVLPRTIDVFSEGHAQNQHQQQQQEIISYTATSSDPPRVEHCADWTEDDKVLQMALVYSYEDQNKST
eukprot:TRINITY_DN9946_c0_g1_i1.p1 TRINITY_DN9946_c0_g1~~TRINITY_DN9946_c0_g1_i1.p1  ORF type:complete len:646 (-),score=110.20 TRINITY_DN9946_c0_g1_i1:66-2003(-)